MNTTVSVQFLSVRMNTGVLLFLSVRMNTGVLLFLSVRMNTGVLLFLSVRMNTGVLLFLSVRMNTSVRMNAAAFLFQYSFLFMIQETERTELYSVQCSSLHFAEVASVPVFSHKSQALGCLLTLLLHRSFGN
jgi:hypothetical protein